MNSFFNIDYSQWETTKKIKGVGVVIVNVSVPSKNDDLNELFLEWEKIFDRAKEENVRYSLIINGSSVHTIEMGMISSISTWIKERYEMADKYINKTAIIINNDTVSSIVNTAMSIFYTPVRPLKVFGGGDLEGGIVWSLSD